MYFLVERHGYDASYRSRISLPKSLCEQGLHWSPSDKTGKVQLIGVGYFFDEACQDFVFVLPKVIMDTQDQVLGEYAPETIFEALPDNALADLAIWLYRSLQVYRQRNGKQTCLYSQRIGRAGHKQTDHANNLLDLLLALIQWGQDNQDFVLFTLQERYAGQRKIDWHRTLNRTRAVLQNGVPIYPNPVTRQQVIDLDEELLIIYYSILQDIQRNYGFPVPLNFAFPLLNQKQMEHYKNGQGVRRLRQIRYKYYADQTCHLWNLCFNYFDHQYKVHNASSPCEYLFCNSYENVFEDMMNFLISDAQLMSLPGLKEQDDGKIIDHIYKDKDLFNGGDIYYIGDSKYYSIGHALGKESIAKQYTYATNVSQWHHDNASQYSCCRSIYWRDNPTEGYNPMPNFFVSAVIEKGVLDYTEPHFKLLENDTDAHSQHFKNRLFDRNTLWLTRYQINLLYVWRAYALQDTSKTHTLRATIRQAIQERLNNSYYFYRLSPKPSTAIDAYLQTHFKALNGKIFRSKNGIYWLALEKKLEYAKANETLLATLQKDFELEPTTLS